MKLIYCVVAVLGGLVLSGCAGPDPVVYKDLASASYIKPNPDSNGGRVPYYFSANVNWQAYDKVMLDTVDIYHGADAQFGDLSEKDKAALADYMTGQFGKKLSQRFQVVEVPKPGTLRIKLTLTGAETNTSMLSVATRFDLAGSLYNGVQAIRGREGMMSGSVLYAIEIYDANSSKLLSASIVKQYPGAYNVGATMGALSAAKVGIEKGADALIKQLK